MNFKIKTSTTRYPITLRRKNGMMKCQCQYEVVGEENNRVGAYMDYFDIPIGAFEFELGTEILRRLKTFKEYGDLTLQEYYQFNEMPWEEYQKTRADNTYAYFAVKNNKELLLKYQTCVIVYECESDKYTFCFMWLERKGNGYDFVSSRSLGKPGLLTFDAPLEFDDTIEPEILGKMILEAFNRYTQITDMAAGNKFPIKEITLLDGSVIEVQMPRDKHFADAEDMGVGEIYQAYEYLPSEDADSSANFYLGIGAELNCDVSTENIRATWEKYYGTAETFEVEEANCGIYTLKAELRNKKFHRISYFFPQSETLLLECAMELFQTGKRRKLDERLTELFEDFAERCRRK